MKRIIHFQSIRGKILFGFLLILLFTLLLIVYNYYSTQKITKNTEEMVHEHLELLMLDEHISFNTSQTLAAIRGYLLFGDSIYKEEFNNLAKEDNELYQRILELNDSEKVNQIIDKTIEWRNIVRNDVFAIYDKGNEEKALQTLSEVVVPMSNDILDNVKEMAQSREAFIKEIGESNISTGESVSLIGIIVSISIFILSILVAFIMARIISKPIKVVTERMDLITHGDFSHSDLRIKSKDEIGQLMKATNEMSRNMKELLNQIQTVSKTVSSHSEELTQSANEVKVGTEQVSATMQELASGTETQANSTGTLASMMNTFTTTILEVNEKGKLIEENSNTVLHMTNEGSLLMNKSVEQMEEINGIVQDAAGKMETLDQQSKEISRLVSVINDVANQTNLLALNASIEAARAGEHGKGFAVVANEVGKLAEQVSISVTEITDIAKAIQVDSRKVKESLQNSYQEVQLGTAQIETTGETFKEIKDAITVTVNHITQITENISEITASTQKMDQSIEEIASTSEETAAGVEQTSALTQQTSSAMEEVAASSVQLADLAEQLNSLVQRFKL